MRITISLAQRCCSIAAQRLVGTAAAAICPIQAKHLEEPCIEVNQRDEPIGSVSKRECHTKPILHRAFSVFLFDTNNRLVLQKRSQTKVTFPGVWTNTCCSHPHFLDEEWSGEEGTKRAAKRKLNHELGIDVDPGHMHVMGRYIYKAASDDVWMEHELDYAICVPNFASTIKPNPEEVDEVRLVTQQQLEHMFAEQSFQFSPWFTLFYSFQWLNLWWNNTRTLEAFKDPKNIHRLN
uniref:isopentenyl-diphosphate Delta-isomerase n=1 Tax=Globodera rostochiensis TaxID=31243 RepID=A0A914HHE8_GLORO